MRRGRRAHPPLRARGPLAPSRRSAFRPPRANHDTSNEAVDRGIIRRPARLPASPARGEKSVSYTLYGIKACDTMKKARTWLDEQGVGYHFHDYKTAGIDREHLQRSEEHTSELQSRENLVCRLLLEKKNIIKYT